MIRAFIMSLACLLFGCATQEQRLEDYVQQYKSLGKPQKALAYGATRDGTWWIGSFAQEMPDLESARRKALSQCDEAAFKKGYKVRCAIMYENDEFVGSRPAVR